MRHNGLATNSNVVDAHFMIFISGLPFSSGYNTRLGPTNQTALGCVNFVSTTNIGITTPLLSRLVTFYKPLQDVFNITVELKNSSLNSLNGFSEKLNTTVVGHWTIVCDIYGVE
jgi:hypothetical protein